MSRGFIMPFNPAKIARYIGAIIAGTVSFALCKFPSLLAFLGPVSADYTAFPPFSTECTIVLTKERWTSFSCLHPLFPLQVSIWISDSSLHSLSKSGLFDLTLPSINHAYNASWFLCTISMHNLQSVFETSYLSIPPTMSL